MSKFILFILVAFVLSGGTTFAQRISNPVKSHSHSKNAPTINLHRCGTMEYMEQLEQADPSLIQKRIDFEEFTRQYVAAHQYDTRPNVITIPVVFHIVYNTAAQNVSDTRVQEALSQLNRDYGGLNPHSMGTFSSTLKANTYFQFCLAQRTPTGTATTGIERVHINTDVQFSTNDAVKSSATNGANSWDVTKYLNIWVCNLGNQLCGYGQFPYASSGGGVNSKYGLVIMYQFFGATGASAPYNNGGTSTHEIGHCFNLSHTWGDQTGCNSDDNCADTPLEDDANYNDHTGQWGDACSASVLYQDFMDYTNDASYACFTPNQATRMQACFAQGGPLYSLTTSNGCTPVGGATLATITTTAATGMANTTATSGGNVTADGGATVSARGVCWATSTNPVATGFHTTDASGTGVFTSSITGLTANTTYHVRAYATNSVGTAYGSDLTFTTTNTTGTVPTLTTTAISAIANTTASSGGNISAQGSAAVSARGVCWSTSANPVITGSNTVNGTGIGTFTSAITGLTAGTTYYVRAYATNTAGTGYGNQVTFTTTGSVTPTGCDTLNYPLTGTIWNSYSNGNNSYADKAKVNYFGTIASSSTIQDVYVKFILAKGTATRTATVAIWNNTGTAGAPGATPIAQKTVTIGTIQTDVTAQALTHITFTTPLTVTGPIYVGVILPTTAGDTVVLQADTSALAGYNQAWEMWSDNAWYAYDDANSWSRKAHLGVFPVVCATVTAQVATLSTSAATTITNTGAVSGGNISAQGSATVTARGVCWATTANPVATGFHTTDGSGTGLFNSSIAGLVANTTYYVRAYATNTAGTGYGNQITFTTTNGGTPVCDTLNYPLISTIWNSYSNGNNSYGDKAKANFFSSFTSTTSIQDVYVKFILAKGTASNTATIAIWNNSGASGTPGSTPIAQKTVTIGTIQTDVTAQALTHITFASPVTLSGPSYIGVILPTAAGDTVVLQADTSSLAGYNQAWEMWSDNAWYSYDDANSWGRKAHLGVFPVVCGSTVSVQNADFGNSINVYPNPTQAEINVDLGKYQSQDVKIIIFNSLGKQIDVNDKVQGNLVKFNFATYANGLYFIQINSPEGKTVKKVSVNK